MNAIDERTRGKLQEALREIHVMAELDGGFGVGVEEGDQDEFATMGRPAPLAIGVTSPGYGDGKTTIAIALASSLSRDFGARATLIDADFATHSVDKEYGLEGQSGFAELLNGSSRLNDVFYPVSATMRVIPAGGHTLEPNRAARSDRLADVIGQLKRSNRYVILDLPAALRSMTTPALAQRCDGVIVVVRHGRTNRQDLERTLHLLKDARILGVVVNRRRSSVPAWVERILEMRQ
ncbi:MAG: CpsD/CapB family tyrosine-protein kinase [Dehalococcoidia bacterium]